MKYAHDSLKIYDVASKEFHHYSQALMCPSSGISYPKPEPNLFSFNSMVGRCPECKGLGQVLTVSEKLLFPDGDKSLLQSGIAGISPKTRLYYRLQVLLEVFGIDEKLPIKDYPANIIKKILDGDKKMKFQGLRTVIEDMQKHPDNYSEPQKKWARHFLIDKTCDACQGDRINLIARHFFILDKNIVAVSQLSIEQLYRWVCEVEAQANDRERRVAAGIIEEIKTRLQFILDVGLSYPILKPIGLRAFGRRSPKDSVGNPNRLSTDGHTLHPR